MDGFSYRFFAPGAMLISVGLLGYVEERLKSWNFRVSIFLSAVLALFSVSLIINVLPYNSSNTAYEIAKEKTTNPLKDVPAESKVVQYDGYGYTWVMRPDITCSTEGIDTTNNFEEWLNLYTDYKYVCVKASSLKDSILDQESSDSFVQLLEYVRDHYEDEEYVVITVKDGTLNK